ncbi:metallophosphoesterase [Dyadobacter chenwenxiniae]|uniref:Metallophosphoesterase n=1 Tax=Dyadobacter chenwenxiniae TaxID=2906456 RepID=A0A9X1PJM6_9BACT|nr:metallophosphoesterase [Dyadobacter chenwenxiniae]MCF0062647.1 metallophosphoesterase [Dyadobacter chenwenxiniae]UON83609.1 metallophosphoesterase [Dyadobacter chenwenxiniae]
MQRRNLLKTIGMAVGGYSVSASASGFSLAPKRILRIAHLTDIHVQPHLWAAKGFEKCLHHLQNLEVKPDLILNTGDSVMGSSGISKEKAAREWALYHKVLGSENSIPMVSCIGNHDIWCPPTGSFSEGKKWAMDESGTAGSYRSFDKNGWHIILLDSIHCRPEGTGYYARLDEAQMDWLKKDLNNTPSHTPVLVASHIPILSASVFFDGDNLKNNQWVVPGSWMHTDSAQILGLFNRHDNVKLAVSGHIHLLDRVVYNSVTYCCNGAVSGNYWMGKYKQTSPGYAIIDLFEDGSFSNQYVNYH